MKLNLKRVHFLVILGKNLAPIERKFIYDETENYGDIILNINGSRFITALFSTTIK